MNILARLYYKFIDLFFYGIILPKKVHQIWIAPNKTQAVPSCFDKFVSSIKDEYFKSYEYNLWDYDRILSFIENYYPWYKKMWLEYPKDVQRCDFARYLILYHYGGIYFDLDIEVTKDFRPILKNQISFICGLENEGSICNAIIGASKRHPIFKRMLDTLEALGAHNTFDNEEDLCYVFNTTGTRTLTKIINLYKDGKEGIVRVVQREAFYPFFWNELNNHTKDYPSSYAKHYWNSGWYTEGEYTVADYWNTGIYPDDRQTSFYSIGMNYGGEKLNEIGPCGFQEY